MVHCQSMRSFWLLLLPLLITLPICNAWIVPFASSPSVPCGSNCRRGISSSSTSLHLSDTSAVSIDAPNTQENNNDDDDDDDDDEWEYVEFESLTEADLISSEWLVGTCWDRSPSKIDETWCRLVTTEKGENKAIWGDNTEGKWSLDVPSQYLTLSKNRLWGKQIWAGLVEDYYYLQGTVRTWTFATPAAVAAQWQAKRLGVDPEEAGTAPWFQANATEATVEQQQQQQEDVVIEKEDDEEVKMEKEEVVEEDSSSGSSDDDNTFVDESGTTKTEEEVEETKGSRDEDDDDTSSVDKSETETEEEKEDTKETKDSSDANDVKPADEGKSSS